MYMVMFVCVYYSCENSFISVQLRTFIVLILKFKIIHINYVNYNFFSINGQCKYIVLNITNKMLKYFFLK